jgi:hypothetical protein
MKISCDLYHRESLLLFPESQLNMNVGFQIAVISAILSEGMTAFFEGQVVTSVWGHGARQSC